MIFSHGINERGKDMDKLPEQFKRILQNYSFWANVKRTLPQIKLPSYEFVEYRNDGKTMIVKPTK